MHKKQQQQLRQQNKTENYVYHLKTNKIRTK